MALDLVGLVDLFEDADVDLVALRRVDDPFARGRFVLGALRTLADRAPTVVAIDDVQWLDPVSAGALRYALRRFEVERVGDVDGGSSPSRMRQTRSRCRRAFRPRRRTWWISGRSVWRICVGSSPAPSPRSRGPPCAGSTRSREGIPCMRSSSPAASSPVGAARAPRAACPCPARSRGRSPTGSTACHPSSRRLLRTASALGPTSVRELRDTLPDLEVDDLLAVAERTGLVVVEEDLEVRLSSSARRLGDLRSHEPTGATSAALAPRGSRDRRRPAGAPSRALERRAGRGDRGTAGRGGGARGRPGRAGPCGRVRATQPPTHSLR